MQISTVYTPPFSPMNGIFVFVIYGEHLPWQLQLTKSLQIIVHGQVDYSQSHPSAHLFCQLSFFRFIYSFIHPFIYFRYSSLWAEICYFNWARSKFQQLPVHSRNNMADFQIPAFIMLFVYIENMLSYIFPKRMFGWKLPRNERLRFRLFQPLTSLHSNLAARFICTIRFSFSLPVLGPLTRQTAALSR